MIQLNIIANLVFLALSATLAGQTNFKAGYLIDADGKRREIEFRDQDWRDNPREFRYRYSEDEDQLMGNLVNVREFGDAAAKIRYRRATVNIDMSSNDPGSMSYSPEPEYDRRTVFLRVLVDGQADLLYWRGSGLDRFFYQIDASTPQPLISRKYIFREGVDGRGDTRIRELQTFRRQLSKEVNCGNTGRKIFAFLGYNMRDLVTFFENYNDCKGNKVITHYRDRGIKVLPGAVVGVDYATFVAEDEVGVLDEDFAAYSPGFRAGADVEFLLPFGNNKWAIPFQVVYQQFQNTYSGGSERSSTLDYEAITLMLGGRYYVFLSDQTSFFLNGQFNYNAPLFAVIRTSTNTNGMTVTVDREIGRSGGFSVGGGIRFSDHYRIELRRNLPYVIAPDFNNFSAKYRGFGLLFTYTP